MLTNDDIAVLEKIFVAEREETRKIVQASENRLDMKMDTIEKRLSEKVERETKDLGGMLHDTWKFIDAQTAELKAEIQSERLKQLEERVAKLESR